jgi:predicted DNA-binding transcriptional regulator YafY
MELTNIHKIIDRCLSDRSGYSAKDIQLVLKYEGIELSTQKIVSEINFLKEQYNAPIEQLFGTKPILCRYEDKNYSVFNHIISKKEKKQLIETAEMLAKYKHNPNYLWAEEVIEKIKSNLHLQEEYARPIVSFAENKLLQGKEHFMPLFNAIKNKTVLKINYHPFYPDKEFEYVIHPYFLKQYNERWFLFGWNNEENKLQNLALDRITSIDTIELDYQDTGIDFENEYFGNIIGVTLLKDEEPTDIILKVRKNRWGYLRTKPLHASQKLVEEPQKDDNFATIKIHIIPNFELYSNLLFYGEDIEVVKPTKIRKKILSIIEKMKHNYEKIK